MLNAFGSREYGNLLQISSQHSLVHRQDEEKVLPLNTILSIEKENIQKPAWHIDDLL